VPLKKQVPSNVDRYIADFPLETRRKLQQVRNAVRRAEPKAEEIISYGMPSYKLNGLGLLSFAGYKHHIGLYPAPAGDAKFNARLARYRAAKSTVRFPLDEPIPLDLVAEIVRLRVKDNLKRFRERAKSRRKQRNLWGR
jgi:uncharacterized protein YdhG (YjbR/CyaY superfamily)